MKTRPIKELLELVLSEGNKDFKTDGAYGICGFTMSLLGSSKINHYEYLKIGIYVESHRPKPDSEHYRPSHKNDSYYWRTQAWGPRKKWLEDQIN